jgi:hypothetical protein
MTISPLDFTDEQAYYEALDAETAPLATPADAIREYATNAGSQCPERAWLLTDYDVWVSNPHYTGPRVPHPEDDMPF